MRIFAPPFIVLIYWWLIGVLTGLWDGALPSWNDVPESTVALIIAVVYYATPARSWSNHLFLPQVTNNLRDELVRIAGRSGSPKTYDWKDVRSIFYVLVDNDPSLTMKAQQAYFNGFIWTTIADARALAALAVIVVLIWNQFDTRIACSSALVFLGIFLISIPLSIAATRRHKNIGNEQLEIIEHFYPDKVKQHFDRLDA